MPGRKPVSEPAPTPTKWWGKFQLEAGEVGRWLVGPLDLWVRRTTLDWRYGVTRGEEAPEASLHVEVPMRDESGVALAQEEARFGSARTDATIELLPLLADRPVVARPAVPFFVPAGQKVELFVSTPVWIRLRSGGADLTELASVRPSDTWFGSNTRGQLAYATKTHLRRSLDDLPQRWHRAVSALTVENASDAVLSVERLSLPVQQLSLFASPSGTLWTEHVSLKKEVDGDMAEVALGKGAPRMAGGGERVSPPRVPQGRSFGSLVFGGLLATRY